MYVGVLRGSQGFSGVVIALVMRAVRGGGAGRSVCSGAGQRAQGHLPRFLGALTKTAKSSN